jgi:hypothetical protein
VRQGCVRVLVRLLLTSRLRVSISEEAMNAKAVKGRSESASCQPSPQVR